MTITCADCGATQAIPDLPPGGIAECHRYDRVLARHTENGNAVAVACAAAIVILLPLATFLPLMSSTFFNVLFGESRLVSSVSVIYSEVWFPFAFGFLFFALLFPFIRAILQVIVFAGSRRQNARLQGAGVRAGAHAAGSGEDGDPRNARTESSRGRRAGSISRHPRRPGPRRRI